MEFNAMAKLHNYDNINNNQSSSGTSTTAAVAAAAAAAENVTPLHNDAYLDGVYNNSYGGLPRQTLRNANDTMDSINLEIVSVPISQSLTGPQQNMYCTSVAHPITVQSMDPSMFDMDQKVSMQLFHMAIGFSPLHRENVNNQASSNLAMSHRRVQ